MLRRLPALGCRAINHPIDLLDQRSRRRAARAMRCLPFEATLYRDLQQQGLDAADLWQDRSRYCRGNHWHRHADALEEDLRWLIRVGVLRREVDGQGLTSRFRLTPLGRQLLDADASLLFEPVPIVERLRHGLRRHWPL